jgi:hypothetical protein
LDLREDSVQWQLAVCQGCEGVSSMFQLVDGTRTKYIADVRGFPWTPKKYSGNTEHTNRPLVPGTKERSCATGRGNLRKVGVECLTLLLSIRHVTC